MRASVFYLPGLATGTDATSLVAGYEPRRALVRAHGRELAVLSGGDGARLRALITSRAGPNTQPQRLGAGELSHAVVMSESAEHRARCGLPRDMTTA